MDSETSFQTLFTSAPIGLTINDAHGMFVHVNPWFLERLGYPEDGLRGMTFRDITDPRDQAASLHAYGELVEGTREAFEIEKRYRRSDGSTMWAMTACSAVRDRDGRFACTFAMIRDITEQKEWEEALHNLVAGTASVTGGEFFSELVRHLAAALHVRYALVSECISGNDRVRSLAYWNDNTWHSTIEYDVVDTTCEEVLKQGKICFYPDHIQQRFPKETALVAMHAVCYLGTPLFDLAGKTIGHIFVIDDKPLANAERARSILAIFAARAATELLRKKTEESLRNLVSGTASVNGREFFPALVRHLATALNVRMAVVAECTDDKFTRSRQLARWMDGRLVSPQDYDLENTPCHVLLTSGKMCYYPDHIQDHFPGNQFLPSIGATSYLGAPLFDADGKAIGHVYVVDTKPLADPGNAKSMMSIFAARAAMELQRNRAEAHVREQAMFLDKAHDAILVCDMEDSIIYWNQAAEALYGWTREDVMGKNIESLMFGAETPQETALARKCTLENGDWNGELRQHTRDGREIIVESRWTLMKNEPGQPRAVLMMNVDITEKKQLEAHFLRAQRMESIGTLAGGIAHDLNNVLTPIMLAAETLQEKSADERTQQLVEMISANARRGSDMANQVLAFARGIEGRRVTIDPKHLVREIEKIAKETFPRTIQIITKTARGIPVISADPTQMHQVLLNLALNARDAMPSGGTLRIATEQVILDQQYSRMHPESRPGEYVVFSVTDSGTGIKQSDLGRIFEPFYTTKDIGKGTGLGLSTVAGIVRAHGGFVNVYSELGKGTSFRVHIPALSAGDALPREERPELVKGNGELILVIDDEMSIRDITKSSLEIHGYRVLVAADGTEALATYAEHKAGIQAVLTDMMMPFLDGAATIRALRKMNPKVRIIAASGLPSNEGFAEGARPDVFLTKPYTTEKLLKALNKVLH